MSKKILSLALALALVLGCLPLSASASGNYTLSVGDTKQLFANTGGHVITGGVWTSNDPSSVVVSGSGSTAKIEVIGYTSDFPVIIQCVYYWRENRDGWMYTRNSFDDFYIYVNKPGSGGGTSTPSDGKITVTFNGNGGTVYTSSQRYTPGQAFGELPIPTRSGYRWTGWYAYKEGGSPVTVTTTVPNYNVTLYAHWTLDTGPTPTPKPTAAPTASPTAGPTASPTVKPGSSPTASPTAKPSAGPTPAPSPLPETGFYDVPVGQWYAQPVTWAVENGITNGKGTGTFKPDDACRRGEIITFLWRAYGSKKAVRRENPFTDIEEGKYYYEAVLWAVENGIASGKGAGTFQPNATCTRAEAMTFLYRAADKPKYTASATFADVTDPDKFFYHPVYWAVSRGITNGKGANAFKPYDVCKRSEIVTFLWRFIA